MCVRREILRCMEVLWRLWSLSWVPLVSTFWELFLQWLLVTQLLPHTPCLVTSPYTSSLVHECLPQKCLHKNSVFSCRWNQWDFEKTLSDFLPEQNKVSCGGKRCGWLVTLSTWHLLSSSLSWDHLPLIRSTGKIVLRSLWAYMKLDWVSESGASVCPESHPGVFIEMKRPEKDVELASTGPYPHPYEESENWLHRC